MKKIKNLFIALLTLITFNSFSQTTYTITQTNNTISCLVNDVLVFQDLSAGSIKTLYVNGVQVGSPFTSTKTLTVSSTFTVGVNTFSVMCSGSTSWSGVITVSAGSTTGVGELSNTSVSELVVFPNPTNGDFKIKFNSNKEKNDVVIYDIQGRLVFQNKDERTIGKNELEISNEFASGIYIVKVENKTFKITVTR